MSLRLGVIIVILLVPQFVWASPWTWVEDYFGRRAYDQGHYPEATQAFEKVISSDPKAEDYYNLGAAQYRQQEYEEAKKNFTAALATDNSPLKEKAYYNLGNALYRLKKLPEALDAYESALEISPDDEEAKLNRDFVKKQLEQKEPPPPQSQPQDKGEGESKGEGQGQEGQNQETPDQDKPSPEGSKGEGEQEEKDQGEEKSKQDPEDNSETGQESKDQNSEESKKESDAEAKPEKGNDPGENKPPESESPDKPQEGEGGADQKSPEQKGEGSPQDKKPQEGSQQNGKNQDSKPSGAHADQPPQPKDLSGPLEADGQAPKSSTGEEKDGFAPAEMDPKAQEAERWLDRIDDHSSEIRDRLIQGAMGRSRQPQKDW